MILAQCHYKQKMLFFPISWREEDQVSNTKLTSFALSLLRMCGAVCRRPQKVCRARDARQARGKVRLPGGGVQRVKGGPAMPAAGRRSRPPQSLPCKGRCPQCGRRGAAPGRALTPAVWRAFAAASTGDDAGIVPGNFAADTRRFASPVPGRMRGGRSRPPQSLSCKGRCPQCGRRGAAPGRALTPAVWRAFAAASAGDDAGIGPSTIRLPIPLAGRPLPPKN